jgi:hypothetical protein
VPERHDRLLRVVVALARSGALAPAAPPLDAGAVTPVSDRDHDELSAGYARTLADLAIGAARTADAHPGPHHDVTGSTGAHANFHLAVTAGSDAQADDTDAQADDTVTDDTRAVAHDVHAAAFGQLG